MRSLFTRGFTLLLLGQISSLIGNYTLKFALSMYVLEVTGSASVFAGLLAAGIVPTILLSPFGGVLADRLDRRRLMVALDALSGLAVLLAGLLLPLGGIPVIGGLLIVLSVLGAFESPTVQACVPQLLPPEQLLRGNALVSQTAALAGLITPFLGSLVYTAFGLHPVLRVTAVCFFLTALLECFLRLPSHRREDRPCSIPAMLRADLGESLRFLCREEPVCFFLTALLECFLRLPSHRREDRPCSIPAMLRADLGESLRFLCREEPSILKLLLLAALASLFVAGVAVVGFPYLVRTVLGLSAEHYGAAESVMGAAAILGSLTAGVLGQRFRARWLAGLLMGFGLCLLPAGLSFLLPLGPFPRYLVGSLTAGVLGQRFRARWLAGLLMGFGLCLLPAGLSFLLPLGPFPRYLVLLAAFAACQLGCSLFSTCAITLIQARTPERLMGKVMSCVFTLSLCAQPLGQLIYGGLFLFSTCAITLIQARTPERLMGKVMSCVFTLSLCAQPLGQLIYGGLFDHFSIAPHWVLLPTGLLVCALAAASAPLFGSLERP